MSAILRMLNMGSKPNKNPSSMMNWGSNLEVAHDF